MRKPGVDTRDDLFGILLIDFVTGLATFFGDSQKAHGLQGFQGISGSGMDHSDPKPEIVNAVDQNESNHRYHESALGEDARREHGAIPLPILNAYVSEN